MFILCRGAKNYVATGYKAGDIIKKSMQLLMVAVVESRILAQGGCPINDKISNIKGELKNFF